MNRIVCGCASIRIIEMRYIVPNIVLQALCPDCVVEEEGIKKDLRFSDKGLAPAELVC